MSTVRHKKWWTVLRCLVSIIGFECFDLVDILNKTNVYSLFVLNSLLLVDTFFPQERSGGVRFEFSLGQQNKLNNVLFVEHKIIVQCRIAQDAKRQARKCTKQCLLRGI